MFKRFFQLFLLLLSIWMLINTAWADGSYEISSYSMSVEVHTDGSASVTEVLVFDFEGAYNGVLAQFDPDGLEGITDLCVYIDGIELTPVEQMNYEKNTYTITHEDGLIKLVIYAPGEDNTRLVTYEYRMLSLAQRYEDTGVIHRHLIGENSADALHNATITVLFPKRAPIQAFAHGAMESEMVSVNENRVQFGPATVYPGNSVEVRLLFPAALLPDAPVLEGRVLDAHLAEEAQIDAQAHERAERIRNGKYLFTGGYTAVFAAVWALIARKYHLKGTLHQTPDACRTAAHPAAFATVAAQDAPDTNALSGTLMELVQKQLIRMENEGDDIRFTRIRSETDDLYPHQQKLLSWLFEKNDSLLLSDLNAGNSCEQAHAFESGYASYCDQVMEDMTAHHLRHKNDALRITINTLIVLLGVAGVGYLLLLGEPLALLGAALLLLTFLLLYLMSRIRTLTDEGEMLRMDVKAFKERGILPGDDVSAFLPYYAALSMTEPLVQAVEERRLDNSVWQDPLYMHYGWHLAVRKLTSSMRDIHNHNASVPDSSSSSSVSLGGSGGANGAGGGHGAW